MKYFWLLILVSINFSCYSLKQTYRFAALYSSSRPVQEVIEDPSFNPKIRERLIYLKDILRYAEYEGLNVSGAYQDYIHLDSGQVSYLVQAAQKDKLKFKTWWFPVIGTVPYLGFFDKADRDQKFLELSSEYDVSKSRVGAFSSLGWFEDPVFTSMLNRSDEGMAHLFFHELIHRSFWSSGSTRFNENLAEFCAEKLVSRFLQEAKDEESIIRYYSKRRDREKYKTWLKSLREELQVLYSKKKVSFDEIMREKQSIISKFQNERLPKFEGRSFQFVSKKEWNNASILGASLYTPETSQFEKAYNCLGKPKIGSFLNTLEKFESKYDNNFEALRKVCDDLAS